MQGRSSPILVRLISFARPYWRIVLLAWVCVLGNAAFTLALPLLLAAAIDTGLGPDGGRTYLIWIGVAVVAMAALRGAFAFGMTYMGEVLSSRVAYDLRNDIYNHLQRLSFAYHDKAQTGQVMSRATQDVEAVRMFISMGLLRLMLLIVLLVAIFFLMISVDWQLTIVAWAFVPIVAWRSINVSSRMRPIWMNVQNLQGRMATVLQENLSGIRVVKAFAREREESIKFAKEAKDLFENSYEANKIQAFNQPLLTGIWMLSLVAVAWFGAYRIDSGNLSFGDLIEFLIYLNILQLPIRSLGWIITMFARTQSAGERIYDPTGKRFRRRSRKLDTTAGRREVSETFTRDLTPGVWEVPVVADRPDRQWPYDLQVRFFGLQADPRVITDATDAEPSGELTVTNLFERPLPADADGSIEGFRMRKDDTFEGLNDELTYTVSLDPKFDRLRLELEMTPVISAGQTVNMN